MPFLGVYCGFLYCLSVGYGLNAAGGILAFSPILTVEDNNLRYLGVIRKKKGLYWSN